MLWWLNTTDYYSATNNTWDSANQKVKILRAASRKFQCETIISRPL